MLNTSGHLESERMLIFVNDKLLPEEKATISVRDRGFIYGDGIFETLLLRRDTVFRMREHLERLTQSAGVVRIDLPWSIEQLAEKVDLTVRENGISDGIIRVNVSRGVGSWRLTVKGATSPTLVITLYPPPDYPPETFTKGWPVIVSKEVTAIDPVIPGRAKTTNRINLILAKNEAEEKGAVEAILLNREGKLTEGTSTNLFFCSRGRLNTPALGSGILRGVTRDMVIDLARSDGFELIEDSYEPSDLFSSDEAFLTFTTAGVVPIHSVDGTVIGDGRAGPITHRMMKHYEEALDREIDEAANRV